MRIGLFADVHANLRALEAVLDQLSFAQVDRLVCLGDLVGYNAEPREVIERVRAVGAVVVAGNHDRDALRERPTCGTNHAAAAAMRWTASRLTEADRAFLAALPGRHEEPGGFVAIHGSFLNDVHTYGYVTGTMLQKNLEMAAGATRETVLAFCGHTHVGMFGVLAADGTCTEAGSLGRPLQWDADARTVLVNPGSVGQPRDGDRRASFAIVDTHERSATFHRIEYDVEAAASAVIAAGLPPELAHRLEEGR